MHLQLIDWLVILAYVVCALWIGISFSRRASRSVDEFFLSGRSLPWWLAGTSMVATTFAADTPLVITGWVRDYGIWKNWLWWSFGLTTLFGVFLFSRLWRRGGVMTKAEIAELRYGGAGAKSLRAFLGVMHSGFTNTITMCWVLLAAAKIVDVLFAVDKSVALVCACVIALSYSLLAGFWGVVLTDMLQFVMSMVGAVVLALLAWQAIGYTDGLLAAAAHGVGFQPDTLRLFPAPGEGTWLDTAFWTTPLVILAVNLGLSWWAVEGVDGGGLEVQRVCASRDERHGMLAVLWYAVTHYALRPWPWILVGLASIVILPHQVIHSPQAGTVVGIEAEQIVIQPEGAGAPVPVSIRGVEMQSWHPIPTVKVGDAVEVDQVIGKTDSERAYVVMMLRYLPVGLLGLVAASLFAAFMSTIDTHVNLAASFFVNDLYRRFWRPEADPKHYVFIARVASIGVMCVAGILAYLATSISDLFQFFLAFLSGVGPVYVLRWLWWRIRASTEIAAMVTSALVTTALTVFDVQWSMGPLSPEGNLLHEGRLIIVVTASSSVALLSMLFTRCPAPETLVPFYEKVRPPGCWGPVAELASTAGKASPWFPILTGVLGGVGLVYGLLFGIGLLILGDNGAAAVGGAAASVGGVIVAWSLRRLR